MKSTASPRFWEMLNTLPRDIQLLAEENYRLWLANPQHPGLQYQ